MATIRRNLGVLAAACGLLAGAVLIAIGITAGFPVPVWIGAAVLLAVLVLWPLVGRRRARVESAEDMALNERSESARATGGQPDPRAPDQHTTTGTTPNDVFVGRVAGEDTGADETTGAERRADRERTDRS